MWYSNAYHDFIVIASAAEQKEEYPTNNHTDESEFRKAAGFL